MLRHLQAEFVFLTGNETREYDESSSRGPFRWAGFSLDAIIERFGTAEEDNVIDPHLHADTGELSRLGQRKKVFVRQV